MLKLPSSSLPVIMSVVSFNGTFVNKDSTSKLAMIAELVILRLRNSLTNLVEFSMVYSFFVKGPIMGTRNLAKLYEKVPIDDIMGRSGFPTLCI